MVPSQVGQSRKKSANLGRAAQQSTAVGVTGLYLEHIGVPSRSMVYSA